MSKPLAPVGKQVRCAVAPKTFVPLGTPTNYITLPWCNGDKRECERTSHPSAHGGSCALSEVLTASGEPRFPQRQRSA